MNLLTPSWQDSSGNNRRMLEVRNAAYESGRDNALVLRDVVDGSYSTYRVFHAGMATPGPIANGGTGASSAANARANIGANNASNLTTGTVPGTVCITDSFQRQIVAADITIKFQKLPFQ